MQQRNKSAKDIAFDKERTKYHQRIRDLEEMIKERNKNIEEMRDTILEKEEIIRQQTEWIERLLEFTELSKDELSKLLENEKHLSCFWGLLDTLGKYL